MMLPPYQCEATSVSGFIQQIAVSYVSNGYFFYVVGWIPEDKNPRAVDQKLLGRYGIHISKWARARRKRAGGANVQYLRHGQLFVLLATHGHHPFFAEEGESVRDLRRVPLKAFGYSVSYRNNHVHVRIELKEFKKLKEHFLERALHRKSATIAAEFFCLRFEPYAPIRRQLLEVRRLVNRTRLAAGFDVIPVECLRLRRRIVKPFAGNGDEKIGPTSSAGFPSTCRAEDLELRFASVAQDRFDRVDEAREQESGLVRADQE